MFGLELQFQSRSVTPSGPGEEPGVLSYQSESTLAHKECAGQSEMGSESQGGERYLLVQKGREVIRGW